MRGLALWAAIGLVGCAAEAPPPPAYAVRGGEPAQAAQWQQFCEQAATVSQASWLVSSRGASGWELVGMSGGVLCYKRPLVQEPAPPSALQPAQPPSGPAPVMVGAAPPSATVLIQSNPPAPVIVGQTASPPPARTSTVPAILDPGF